MDVCHNNTCCRIQGSLPSIVNGLISLTTKVELIIISLASAEEKEMIASSLSKVWISELTLSSQQVGHEYWSH